MERKLLDTRRPFTLWEDEYNEDEELAIPIVTCSDKGV